VRQGWNSRLDELQAAILRVKLGHLDEWSGARRSRAAYYDRLLQGIPGVERPKTAENREHVFHQYTVRVAQREGVSKELAERGIPSTVYYPVPIHLQPIYDSLGYKQGDLPETERASHEVLSLPIYPELTDLQIELVVASLADVVRR
jgi:dTDP-4-amino-4,6-dideoxygalactose transaminase